MTLTIQNGGRVQRIMCECCDSAPLAKERDGTLEIRAYRRGEVHVLRLAPSPTGFLRVVDSATA